MLAVPTIPSSLSPPFPKVVQHPLHMTSHALGRWSHPSPLSWMIPSTPRAGRAPSAPCQAAGPTCVPPLSSPSPSRSHSCPLHMQGIPSTFPLKGLIPFPQRCSCPRFPPRQVPVPVPPTATRAHPIFLPRQMVPSPPSPPCLWCHPSALPRQMAPTAPLPHARALPLPSRQAGGPYPTLRPPAAGPARPAGGRSG